jgi:hypothetical protein
LKSEKEKKFLEIKNTKNDDDEQEKKKTSMKKKTLNPPVKCFPDLKRKKKNQIFHFFFFGSLGLKKTLWKTIDDAKNESQLISK